MTATAAAMPFPTPQRSCKTRTLRRRKRREKYMRSERVHHDGDAAEIARSHAEKQPSAAAAPRAREKIAQQILLPNQTLIMALIFRLLI